MSHLASSQQDPGLQAVAHTSLCKILQTYLDSMVVGDDEAIEQLGELPSAIFLSYKVKDAAYRAVVDLNVEKPCKMAPMRRGAAFTGRGIRAIIGCV